DDIYHTLLKLFHYDNTDLFTDYKQDADNVIGEYYDDLLLNIDTQRADLQPYHSKILDDTALGHWSLWQDELNTQDYVTVDLVQKR
ncbi:hypothetical protein JG661_21035, partial [Vibrio cholerae]